MNRSKQRQQRGRGKNLGVRRNATDLDRRLPLKHWAAQDGFGLKRTPLFSPLAPVQSHSSAVQSAARRDGRMKDEGEEKAEGRSMSKRGAAGDRREIVRGLFVRARSSTAIHSFRVFGRRGDLQPPATRRLTARKSRVERRELIPRLCSLRWLLFNRIFPPYDRLRGGTEGCPIGRRLAGTVKRLIRRERDDHTGCARQLGAASLPCNFRVLGGVRTRTEDKGVRRNATELFRDGSCRRADGTPCVPAPPIYYYHLPGQKK